MKVIALKEHEYEGKMRPAGEVYDADLLYTPLMLRLGWVRYDEDEPKSKRHYKRRDMEAETTSKADA